MAKTKENVKASEKFIRELLAKRFNQKKIDAESLRAAAEKLCEAVPDSPVPAAPVREAA